MKKYLKCKDVFYHNRIPYFTIGYVYIVKQTAFNQNVFIVGGICLLKPREIKKHFEDVLENDTNKILCIKDYFHNKHRHYAEGFDYYLHEINWERGVVYLSSNFHAKICTELSIIKEHFDLNKILRKRKI
ncbi:MAG: hypothetical protein RLZZ546_2100 [Bacteroidota bacterium]